MSKPDFGPGDLVVCVKAGVMRRNGVTHYGGILLVEGRVYRCIGAGLVEQEQCILLEGVWSFDPSGMFNAKRFRKIDKADDEFTAQIRACRPVPGKVPA